MDEFKIPILPQKNEAKVETTETLPPPPPPVTVEPKKPKAKNTCPYKVPHWSGTPSPGKEYKFEVLKSGQILEEVKDLHKQAVWTFGRLPENDIEMVHPTISRFHAILQYRLQKPNTESSSKEVDTEDSAVDSPSNFAPEGWYIYDLESTHGSFLNKHRIPPRVYIRVRVGHMLKFGGSTRSFILQGPADDEEPESELSVTELREKRKEEVERAALEEKRKIAEAEERNRNEGISWGMSEDADEETDLTHNPYASTNNEELFLDDPKKTLRGYFEREGLDLEYKCDEMSTGSFVCRVELPLDDSNGRAIVAEVAHKGRKKDCVAQCALEACRILDRHGVLRQANQEPLKRKVKSNSDSDDEFWDRTGDVERKKQRKQNTNASVALTYEELLSKANELRGQSEAIEKQIEDYHESQKRIKENKEQNAEDLDSFMENLDDGKVKLDKTEIRKLRLEQQRIKGEQQKVQVLIKIAKPTDFSSLKPTEKLENTTQPAIVKKQLPMVGKRNQFSKFRVIKPATTEAKVDTTISLNDDSEEFDQLTKEDNSNTDKSIKIDTAAIENPEDKNPKIDDALEGRRETSEPKVQDHSDNCTPEETKESKKRRQRQRLRPTHQRQMSDSTELEEHESSEKYAKWVPPENQTGDGITPLNEKFGY